MANDYFNHISNVIPEGIRALAAQVNNIANEIATGLDKLPTEIQLKRGTTRFAVDTGAADAYVVALPYVPTLQDGLEVTFRAINANTGASTVNVNALGAKSIVYFDLTALTANAIVAGSMVTLRYSSTGDHFVMISQSGKVTTIGDADTLDGIDSTGFVRSDAVTTLSNTTVDAVTLQADSLTTGQALVVASNSPSGNGNVAEFRIQNATANGVALLATAAGNSQIAGQFQANGTATGILVQGVGTSAKGIQITHPGQGANAALDIQLSDDGRGLLVQDSSSSLGGIMGYFYSDNATRSAVMVNIINDNASSFARPFEITQDGNADAILVNHNATGAGVAGLEVNNQNTSRGIWVHDDTALAGANQLLYVTANNANRTNQMLGIYQQNIASQAVCLQIQNDSTANGGGGISLQTAGGASQVCFDITGTHLGRGLSISQGQTTGDVVYIEGNSKTGGNVVNISANNAAYASGALLRINQDHASAAAVGIQLLNDGTGNPISIVNGAAGAAAVIITHSPTGATDGIFMQSSSSGNAIYAEQNSAAGTAIRAYSNTASRTQPLVEIINDNGTGTGDGLTIQEDQDGSAIDIDHNHVSGAGQAINIDCVNARGIVMTASGSGNAIDASAWGTGRFLRLVNPGMTSTDMIDIQTTALTSGRVISIFSNASGKVTTPLVRINQAHATPTVPVLELNQAGDGAHIAMGGTPAPASPTDGHFWSDGNTFYGRINGNTSTMSPLTAGKAATTTRSNDATPSDDPDLTVNVEANTVYHVEAFLIAFSGSVTPDIQVEWIEPTSAAVNLKRHAITEGFAHILEGTGLQTFALPVSTDVFIHYVGTLRTVGTAGTFKLQWSQATSNATGTSLLWGSWLKLTKMAS